MTHVRVRGGRVRVGIQVPNGKVVYGQYPGSASRRLREHELRDRLAEKVGGITEACLPYSRPDVLTETTAFEVEPLRSWTKGANQALGFAAATGCRPALALFGEASPDRVLRMYLTLRDGTPPIELWCWFGYGWEHVTSRRACRALHA
jgi:hypothetical protein